MSSPKYDLLPQEEPRDNNIIRVHASEDGAENSFVDENIAKDDGAVSGGDTDTTRAGVLRSMPISLTEKKAKLR